MMIGTDQARSKLLTTNIRVMWQNWRSNRAFKSFDDMSTTGAMPGIRIVSSARSCPSPGAIGQMWVIQCDGWYKSLA